MNNDKKFRLEYYRYGAGFLAALFLTYAIYYLSTGNILEGLWLAVVLLVIASIQVGLQLVVFLDVLEDKKPNWIIWSIVYTVITLLIIVAASLWIMASMNYNMHMSPEQMEQFMLEQNKKGF